MQEQQHRHLLERDQVLLWLHIITSTAVLKADFSSKSTSQSAVVGA